MKLVDFELVALLSSYGMIRWLLPALHFRVQQRTNPSPTRLLINMTVQSVQQIRRQPESNPENETTKATQHKICL